MRSTTSFLKKNPHCAKGNNISFATSYSEYVTAGVDPNLDTDNFDDKFDGTLSNSDDDPKQSQQEDNNSKNIGLDDGNKKK